MEQKPGYPIVLRTFNNNNQIPTADVWWSVWSHPKVWWSGWSHPMIFCWKIPNDLNITSIIGLKTTSLPKSSTWYLLLKIGVTTVWLKGPIFDSYPHISTSLKLLSSTCQDWCSWKEKQTFFHRENGGTLAMLPLIIYKSHIHLIQWVFVGSQSHFKGLQQGELNSYGQSSQKIPPCCWKDPIQNCILKGGICVWSHCWWLKSCSTWDV